MRPLAALIFGIATLVAASCSGQAPGSSEPPATGEVGTSTGTTSPSTALNVPKVTDPINMSKYIQNPCAALTESQLEKLSVAVEPQARLDAPNGPVCAWDAVDKTGFSVSGSPITAGSSLAGTYRRYRQGGFENFKPMTVAGYPGVLTRRDGEKNSCRAGVAVRQDLLYVVIGDVPEDSSYYGKPCVYVTKAATMATMTMSGGS